MALNNSFGRIKKYKIITTEKAQHKKSESITAHNQTQTDSIAQTDTA